MHCFSTLAMENKRKHTDDSCSVKDFFRIIHVIMFLYFFISSECYGQENRNYSGLKNAELKKCWETKLEGSGLATWPPSGSKASGAIIDRFVITEDKEAEFR